MQNMIWFLILPMFLLGCSKEDAGRKAQGHANLAIEAAERSDFEEAARLLETALSRKPKVPEYMVGLGSMYARMGDKSLAVEKYLEALKIYEKKDNEANSWNQRVFVLYLLNRKEEMKAVLDEGRRIFPEDESLKMVEEDSEIFAGFNEWKAQ